MLFRFKKYIRKPIYVITIIILVLMFLFYHGYPRPNVATFTLNEHVWWDRKSEINPGSRGFSDTDIEKVRSWIAPPSMLPYNLSETSRRYVINEPSLHIGSLTNGKKNGYFVDVGAGDGETGSMSLYFEIEYNWTGLLIESGYDLYKQLLFKHRKSYSLNACVRLMEDGSDSSNFLASSSITAQIPCISMTTLLLATNKQQIDLLIINSENQELKLLKTLPWNEVYIEYLSIRVSMDIERENLLGIILFMKTKGYSPTTQFVNHVTSYKCQIFQYRGTASPQ